MVLTDTNGNAQFTVTAGQHLATATLGDHTASKQINVTQDGQIFTLVLGQVVSAPPNWEIYAAIGIIAIILLAAFLS